MEFHPVHELKTLFQVNALGPMYLTQKILPTLRQSKGRVIFVSSLASVISSPLLGGYASTKRAVAAFAEALRLELRGLDVSVSTIAPAYVKTDIFDKVSDGMDHHNSEEAKAVYAHHFRPEVRERDHKNFTLASPPSVTTDAIYDALTNPWPKARYVVRTIVVVVVVGSMVVLVCR